MTGDHTVLWGSLAVLAIVVVVGVTGAVALTRGRPPVDSGARRHRVGTPPERPTTGERAALARVPIPPHSGLSLAMHLALADTADTGPIPVVPSPWLKPVPLSAGAVDHDVSPVPSLWLAPPPVPAPTTGERRLDVLAARADARETYRGRHARDDGGPGSISATSIMRRLNAGDSIAEAMDAGR